MKSLTLAQMSTASMGKFDKKVNKHEPDAPSSQTVKKKKSNKNLHALESDRGTEKNRDLKILGLLQREKEIASVGVSADKSKAALNKDKMVKKFQKKSDKMRSKLNQ